MSRRTMRLAAHLRQIGGGKLEQRILFLHIPKCGGTSVREAIGAAYGWRPGRQSREARLDPAASWRGSQLMGMGLAEFREKLLVYELCRAHLHYVSGHYPLSLRAMEEFGDEWDVITVLRHPVDRWLSEFFYNKHKDSDYFAHDMTVEDYLESHTGKVQSRTYVRWFSGELSNDWSNASVEEALDNMDRCALIGLLEDLGSFRTTFRERYSVDLRIPKLNTNPQRTEEQRRVISPEVRERVEALCAEDIRIYERARELQAR